MYYKGPFSCFLSYRRIEVTFCEERKLSSDFPYLLFMQAYLGFQTSQLASICSSIKICVLIMKIFDWQIAVSSPLEKTYTVELYFLLNPGRYSSLHFHGCLCMQALMVYDYSTKHSTVHTISPQKAEKWHGFRSSKAQEHFFRLVKITVINILEKPW